MDRRAVRCGASAMLVAWMAWSCTSDRDGGEPGGGSGVAGNGEAGADGTPGSAGEGGSSVGDGGSSSPRGGRAGDSGRGGESGDGRGGSDGGTAGSTGGAGAGTSGTAGEDSAGAGGSAGEDGAGAGGSAGADGGEGGDGVGDDPCSPNPCSNSGACVPNAGQVACKCKVGFAGERCEEDVGIHFVSMSRNLGAWHVCGVLDDGRIDCRGNNEFGQASPPPGRYQQVEVGSDHTCALRTDGRIVCFGDDSNGKTSAPTGTFVHLSLWYSRACAARNDGTVVCWGEPGLEVLAGAFTQVSLPGMCGIRVDGTLACSRNLQGALPPEGVYRHIATGIRHNCAITMTGSVACWGGAYAELKLRTGSSIVAVPGTFESLSVGVGTDGEMCGLRSDGTVLCWWVVLPSPGIASVEHTTWAGTFRGISLADEIICVIRPDGRIGCTLHSEPRPLPSGLFLDVAVEVDRFSVIRSDASGASFDADLATLLLEHPGPLKQLSGAAPGWNLAQDGTIVAPSGTVPSGTFTDLSYGVIDSVGGYCGVRSSGALSCWPWNNTEETSPVTGGVRQVTLSHKNGCAIREDGTLACWGQNRLGQGTPPSGAFARASRGPNHGCAIRVDGTVACWGRNDDGEATPPPGRFVQVSARGAHTCGIRTNGELACWGANGSGQASPPAGTYVRVSAGGLFSCAIATDQSLVCWGERRQSYANL